MEPERIPISHVEEVAFKSSFQQHDACLAEHATLSLALPCIVLDASGHALKALGIHFVAKYVYDIQ